MSNKSGNKASKSAAQASEEVPKAQGSPVSQPQSQDKAREVSIGDEIDEFIRHIDSLSTTFPLTMVAIKRAHKVAREQYDEFEKKHCKQVTLRGKSYLLVNANHEGEYQRLSKQDTRVTIASTTVPRSFVVSLVSQYDSFLGRLIRAFFYLRPELLSSSEKLLSFSKLSEFVTLEDAKEYIIEKEVETVLRKSHSDQFDWLENKLGTTLRKDLPIWSTFIEVTERRNLFVHSNGVVSSQYLQVCREHGVGLEKGVKVGTVLGMTPEYFDTAYRALYELGTKLAHVIWRRQNPADISKADSHLISVCYDLLREEKYELAKVLLDFATLTLKKHYDEENRRIFVVNRAQAYKWSGDEKTATEIMASEDWSATSNEFKLADAVLTGNFARAKDIMKAIGSNGTPSQIGYKDWPLFKEFRKSTEFLETYEEVFGEPFNRVEAESGEVLQGSNVHLKEARVLALIPNKRGPKPNGKPQVGEEKNTAISDKHQVSQKDGSTAKTRNTRAKSVAVKKAPRSLTNSGKASKKKASAKQSGR